MKKIITVILFSAPLFFKTFSQCYNVSSIPYVPASFSSGTHVFLGDDNYSQVIPIGFNFCFYGETYSKLVIGANAVISFDTLNAGTNSLTHSVLIPDSTGTRS